LSATSIVDPARRAGYLTAQERRRARRERRRAAVRPGATIRTELITDLRTIRRRREDPPVSWPGTIAFARKEYSDHLNEVGIVRIAKASGLFDALLDAERGLAGQGGANRMKGSFVLAFLAFVQSGEANILKWRRETSAELWWEAGFDGRPSYATVHRRFEEFEERMLEDFFEATIPVIRLAQQRSGGLVGWDTHQDSTEATTNARLHHDCRPDDDEPCPGWHVPLRDRHGRTRDLKELAEIRANQGKKNKAKKKKRAEEFGDFADDDWADDEAPGPGGPVAQTAGILSADDAAAMRRQEAREPLDEDGQAKPRTAPKQHVDHERGVLRIRIGKHWYCCRDLTAGHRAQTGGRGRLKVWLGYLNTKLSCHTFGQPLVNLIESADETEEHLLEEILRRAEAILGEDHIRSMCADNGMGSKAVHLLAAERGITAITPWRPDAHNAEGLPPDHDDVDRDGIPRCRFCGGQTEFVRFSRFAPDQSKAATEDYERALEEAAKANGGDLKKAKETVPKPRKIQPRLWFVCAQPRAGHCTNARGQARVQTVLIASNPRQLRALWSTTPAYQALREVGLSGERVHHLNRVQHNNGAKDSKRPARVGREWQQLRAHASVALSWLKTCWIQGWLDGVPDRYRRNPERPYLQIGDALAEQMQAERRAERLHIPYGPPADKLGISEGRPSRTKVAVNADPDRITLRMVLDPATGEVLADQLTAQQAAAHIRALPKDLRNRAVTRPATPVIDDFTRRDADPPDTGPPPPTRAEHDIVRGTSHVPGDGIGSTD
jgi:hypothetical protein